MLMKMKQRVQETRHIELIPEVRFAEMSENQKMREKPLNVLVLKGGCSSEREVSLESGHAIAGALREKGYNVSEYDIRELALSPEMKAADIVWPVLHGGFGEDGRIQKLLEEAGIPFVKKRYSPGWLRWETMSVTIWVPFLTVHIVSGSSSAPKDCWKPQ